MILKINQKFLAMTLALIFVTGMTSPAFAGLNNAVEIDSFTCTRTIATLTDPSGATEQIIVNGPTTVQVNFEGPNEGDANDDDGPDGLDEVQTEIIQMNLVGTSSLGPVLVKLSPLQHLV